MPEALFPNPNNPAYSTNTTPLNSSTIKSPNVTKAKSLDNFLELEKQYPQLSGVSTSEFFRKYAELLESGGNALYDKSNPEDREKKENYMEFKLRSYMADNSSEIDELMSGSDTKITGESLAGIVSQHFQERGDTSYRDVQASLSTASNQKFQPTRPAHQQKQSFNQEKTYGQKDSYFPHIYGDDPLRQGPPEAQQDSRLGPWRKPGTGAGGQILDTVIGSDPTRGDFLLQGAPVAETAKKTLRSAWQVAGYGSILNAINENKPIQSNALFSSFSWVPEGFGNGPDNQLYLRNKQAGLIRYGIEPLMHPRQEQYINCPHQEHPSFSDVMSVQTVEGEFINMM